MKVTQFGAVMLQAWEQASLNQLRVDCGPGEPGRKKAVHLRYRLYMLRKALFREEHPLYDRIIRCKLSLVVEPGPPGSPPHHILIGSTADKDLEDLLEQSGVNLPPPPPFAD